MHPKVPQICIIYSMGPDLCHTKMSFFPVKNCQKWGKFEISRNYPKMIKITRKNGFETFGIKMNSLFGNIGQKTAEFGTQKHRNNTGKNTKEIATNGPKNGPKGQFFKIKRCAC